MAAAQATTNYPVRVEIDYSDTSDRLSVFFRYFLAIPHMIVLMLYAFAAMVVMMVAWFAIGPIFGPALRWAVNLLYPELSYN